MSLLLLLAGQKTVRVNGGDGQRRSLRAVRRMLARRLSSLQLVTTTASGKSDGSTLISVTLANQFDSNRNRAWWVMPTEGSAAGDVRTLGNLALNTVTGEVVVKPPFSAEVITDTQIEFHKLLPPVDMDGFMGLNTMINLALAECWVIDRHAFTTLDQSMVWDISAFGDWLDPEAIVEVYSPVLSTQSQLTVPWSGFRPHSSLENIYVDVSPGWAQGSTAGIELTRPADTYVQRFGAWGADGGLQNDDDQSLLQPQFLVEVALKYAYRELANNTSGPEKAVYTKLADDQETRAAIAKWRGLPHPSERTGHGLAAPVMTPDPWWMWQK